MSDWLDWGENTRTPAKKREKELLHIAQKGRCMYCGQDMDPRYFHVDHKTPLDRDGSDGIANKQLLCGPCNNRKHTMTDGEFRRVYKLTKSREAAGPPSRVIPQSHFDDIKKERDRNKRKRNNSDEFSLW